MELRKYVEKKTGIRILDINSTPEFTNNLESFENMLQRPLYHLYKCKGCLCEFGVTQKLDDQSFIKCPNCNSDEIEDDGQGELSRKE